MKRSSTKINNAIEVISEMEGVCTKGLNKLKKSVERVVKDNSGKYTRIEWPARKIYYMVEKNIVKTRLGGRMADLSCGKCESILYGYDEVVCPVCGTYNYVK